MSFEGGAGRVGGIGTDGAPFQLSTLVFPLGNLSRSPQASVNESKAPSAAIAAVSTR